MENLENLSKEELINIVKELGKLYDEKVEEVESFRNLFITTSKTNGELYLRIFELMLHKKD